MLFDKDFLNHILDEIDFIERTTLEKDIDLLLEDEIMQRAIVRSIGIIGQASKNVSNEFKEKHPEVEWRKIASTRK